LDWNVFQKGWLEEGEKRREEKGWCVGREDERTEP
jgi:hypothetical protein